jgi:hypothetical protein
VAIENKELKTISDELKNSMKGSINTYLALEKNKHKPYAFKIHAIYELAIRNPNNLRIMNDIVNLYDEQKKSIADYIQKSKNDQYYSENNEGDIEFHKGNESFDFIVGALRELKIFSIRLYDDSVKKIYSRQNIFSDSIFDAINAIARYQEHLDGLYNQIKNHITRIHSEADITTAFNKIYEIRKTTYKKDNSYEADEEFICDKYYGELNPIILAEKNKKYNIYLIDTRVFIEYIKQIDEINTFYTEVIECYSNERDVTEYFDDEWKNGKKSYDDLLKFLQEKDILKIVKFSKFDFINDALPFLNDTKHRNVTMNKSYMLHGLENNIFTNTKMSTLHFAESELLDAAATNVVKSEPFAHVKNLLDKPDKFLEELFTYDCITYLKKKQSISLKAFKKPAGADEAIRNIIQEDLKITPRDMKTFRNNQSLFANAIEQDYCRYF